MKPTATLTNFQTELADKAGEAWTRHNRACSEAIEAYLETGRVLIEARKGCKHGAFGALIERAGIPKHTAYRTIRLAEYGVKSCTVQLLGGIAATLETLAVAGRSKNPRETFDLRVKITEDVKRIRDDFMALRLPFWEAIRSAGAGLVEIKAEIHPGDWLPELDRIKLPDKDALNYMGVARSGLSPIELVDLEFEISSGDADEAAVYRELRRREKEGAPAN